MKLEKLMILRRLSKSTNEYIIHVQVQMKTVDMININMLLYQKLMNNMTYLYYLST